MPELIFLQDLAVVMVISAAIMIVCQRFRLPVVLGYILAGVIISPHTPPFPLISNFHNIHILSELGVIFLLLSIGLEFSLTKLAKVGFVALIAATLEILLMIWIGYSAGRAFGWNFMDSLFLGALLSISSTTIIAKVLMEMKKLQEKFAQVILGILIIEDLLAIVIIALLSGIASTGSLEIREIGIAIIKVASFIIGILFSGFLLVPKLLRYVAKFQNSEIMVITVLGLCFAASLAAAKFGFSVALGSFLVGAIIAETKHAKEIVHKMEPIRDMFTAIFFVSVGMLIDPAVLAKLWLPILIITLITIIGKIVSCSFATFLTGYRGETALKVGLGLAQIGEFSFIIARLGESAGVTSPFIYPLAVSVSGITTLTTPFLMKNTTSIIKFLNFLTPKPLVTLFNLYTSWFERAGENRSERQVAATNGLKTYTPRLFLYGILSIAFFYGISHFQSRHHFLPADYWWIPALIFVFPLFIGFAHTLDRIAWDVLFLNLVKPKNESEQTKDAGLILHNTVRFFMVLIAGFLFLGVGSFFLPQIPLAIAVAGLIFISGLFLWTSILKTHEKIEKIVLGIFDQEKPLSTTKQAAAHDELINLIREEYPWDVHTEDFLLPYKESALNQSLKDLRLRSETGASIVALYRGEESIPNPSPEMKLLPGDVLLLMGDEQQIKAAIEFLGIKSKQPPVQKEEARGVPKTQSFEMPAGSPFLGRTVREIRLRRKTGVNILGIQKGQISINNPDPETVLEKGDILILFGLSEAIDKAVNFLTRG